MRSIMNHGIRQARWRSLGTLSLVVAVLALAIAAATATSARAQAPPCATREAVLAHFAARYHELPVGVGVTATGGLLEVLASTGGSWTIVITQPGGPTCVVMSGQGWRSAPPQTVEKPAV